MGKTRQTKGKRRMTRRSRKVRRGGATESGKAFQEYLKTNYPTVVDFSGERSEVTVTVPPTPEMKEGISQIALAMRNKKDSESSALSFAKKAYGNLYGRASSSTEEALKFLEELATKGSFTADDETVANLVAKVLRVKLL